MSKLYRATCFPDSSSAEDAYFSSAEPYAIGNPPTIFLFEKSLSGWSLNGYQSGTLISTNIAPTPAFADCDPGESVRDGASLGFSVALVLIVAWTFRIIASIIRS